MTAPGAGSGGPVVVLFDAGNTLIELDFERIAGLVGEVGERPTADGLRLAEQRARIQLDRLLESGVSTEDPRLQAHYTGSVLRQAGFGVDGIDALVERIRAADREASLWSVAAPDVPAVLAHLRAAGWRLGVISNADGRVAATLERLGCAPHLEVIIDSARVGVEKPDPRIFWLACEQLGVAPEQAVYVGDLAAVDVAGGRRAGLSEVILIDPAGAHRQRDGVRRVSRLGELPELLGEPGEPCK